MSCLDGLRRGLTVYRVLDSHECHRVHNVSGGGVAERNEVGCAEHAVECLEGGEWMCSAGRSSDSLVPQDIVLPHNVTGRHARILIHVGYLHTCSVREDTGSTVVTWIEV